MVGICSLSMASPGNPSSGDQFSSLSKLSPGEQWEFAKLNLHVCRDIARSKLNCSVRTVKGSNSSIASFQDHYSFRDEPAVCELKRRSKTESLGNR